MTGVTRFLLRTGRGEYRSPVGEFRPAGLCHLTRRVGQHVGDSPVDVFVEAIRFAGDARVGQRGALILSLVEQYRDRDVEPAMLGE